MTHPLEIPVEALSRSGQEHAEFFASAGDEYHKPPALDIDPDQITHENGLSVVAENYFEKMAAEPRDRVYTLASRLRENDGGETLLDPDITVCIPIAMHQEGQHTLETTLGIIARQEDANVTEVILYANHPQNIPGDRITESYERMKAVIDTTKEAHPQLRVRYVVAEYDDSEMSMGGIRKDMMDVVVWDAVSRGLGYDQPVIWLDADVTQMSQGAVRAIGKNIREHPAYLQHMNSKLTIDGLRASSIGAATLAERVAADYEVRHRRNVRQALSRGRTGSWGYNPESGLGFMLGNYVAVGGVNPADPMNESHHLANGFVSYGKQADKIMSNATWNVIGEDEPYRPVIHYIREASVYTSGRRLVASAQRQVEYVEASLRSLTNPEILDEHPSWRIGIGDIGNMYGGFFTDDGLRSGEGASITEGQREIDERRLYDLAIRDNRHALRQSSSEESLRRLWPPDNK